MQLLETVLASGLLNASVVINTYNRAEYLRNAVISIAAQSYCELELVVVNGPSTDDTESVLDALENTGLRIKRARCQSRNLAESRNVGIRATAGDVVLFMDDDAVAHREWVGRLMRAYNDPSVGAAGGFTFDHTGMSFQCRYTVCDKFGNARFFDTIDPETFLAKTSDFFFPSLLGTNCSFLRGVLDRIGGFDEVFEYMLDETDVCARIVERATRIVTVPNAYVFHKYAPSETRTHERIPTSLLAPARSKAYFCLKHSPSRQENALDFDVIAEIEKYRKDIDFSNKWFLDHKKITPTHYTRLSRELAAGIAEGLQIGMNGAGTRPAPRVQRAAEPTGSAFSKISAGASALYRHERPLKIYFVSQGYPPSDTAGIARWTQECALQLSRIGHEVHVITRSQTRADHIDFRGGIWIHAVTDAFDEDLVYTTPVPIPDSIARRATAVLREIRRSENIWGVDVVSAPIWDLEGILCCAHLRKPVVTSLHTTYKLAMPFKPEWSRDSRYKTAHVDPVIAGEFWLLGNSTAILANSQQVIAEINRSYDGVLGQRGERVTTILHGLGSPVPEGANARSHTVRAGHETKLKVLFVGRLEERKGPDQLLAALAQIPAVLGQIEITFVGRPSGERDPYRTQLTKMADSLKKRFARTTLTFVGHVSEAELERHYASADVFVAPSRFESFGLVLIEAMRHGLPVIACDIGGMRDIIKDGVDGYLVRVDDTAQLASRLKSLIENGDLRRRLGERGRETYESRFTGQRMAESMERMFSSIAQEIIDE